MRRYAMKKGQCKGRTGVEGRTGCEERDRERNVETRQN